MIKDGAPSLDLLFKTFSIYPIRNGTENHFAWDTVWCVKPAIGTCANSFHFKILQNVYLWHVLWFQGLPVQVRDHALGMKDDVPKSDVNKEYYTQNVEKEVSVLLSEMKLN